MQYSMQLPTIKSPLHNPTSKSRGSRISRLSTRTCVTMDDPSGHRSRFERLYNKMAYVSPELIRSRLLFKTSVIYDCDLKLYGENYHLDILNSTEVHSPNRNEKLQKICNSVNKWMVAHVVREALEEISKESIDQAFSRSGRYSIPLGVSALRMTEFDSA